MLVGVLGVFFRESEVFHHLQLSFGARLSCCLGECLSLLGGERASKPGHTLDSAELALRKEPAEGEDSVGLLLPEPVFQLLVALEVVLGEGVLEVGQERAFLHQFEVVVDHLVVVKLRFLAFLLVLVGVLGVFVEAAVRIEVHSDLENLAAILISPALPNCFLEHLKGLSDRGVGIGKG